MHGPPARPRSPPPFPPFFTPRPFFPPAPLAADDEEDEDKEETDKEEEEEDADETEEDADEAVSVNQ